MGASATRPYIIDDFDSDNDDEGAYESAVENMVEPQLANAALECATKTAGKSCEDDVSPSYEISDPTSTDPTSTQEGLVEDGRREEETQETQLISSSSPNTLKGLDELLKLIESHDFDGAQKVACHLKMSHAPASVSQSQSVKSEESSGMTSSWPSKTHEEVTDKLSSILQEQSGAAGDLTNDQRKALALLDEELIQFEVNEEKIVNETPILHSGIPRLISGSVRSGRSAEFATDVSKKPPAERKRSPSPHGSRVSGIPRYTWAHVAPISPNSSLDAKTEAQTIDASSSNTLESLPELSYRRQTSTNKSNSTSDCSECQGNHCQSTNETTSDSHVWNVNLSEQTGRVKMRKKHSCLPPLWVKIDGPQTYMKSPHHNEYHLDSSSTTTFSEMATAEKVACKSIGEWGGVSGRKVLDLRRWYCISRPQYKTSCGISAVVSCWNYLFSTMGHGSLSPLTQETAMKILGFASPFDSINFGPLTGNHTLLRWFSELNTHFNVNGQCSIMYKPSGKNQTISVTEQMALDSLKKGLKDHNTAFIYHCHNHYFCPIGYEDTSQFCVDAYKSDIGEHVDSWVLFGDTSRKYSPIYCQSWEKICLDLNCKSPSYFNIRQSWKGVMQRKNITKVGENLHCIMTFQKVTEHLLASPLSVSSSISNSSCLLTTNSSRPPFRQNSFSASLSRLSPGMRSAVDTLRPELRNNFPADLEEEEVGCENLESDNSGDDIANEVESAVNEIKNVFNGIESAVDEVKSVFNGVESSVDGAESAVEGDEDAVDRVESAVNGDEGAVDRVESAVDGDESAVDIVESDVDEAESAVDGNEGAFDEVESAVDGVESAVDGDEIAVDGVESAVDVVKSAENGIENVMNEVESAVNESES